MIAQGVKLKERPLLTGVLGWLFFPGMYFLVGLLTALGVSVENAFIWAAPAGLIGFVCWVAGLIFSLQHLRRSKKWVTALAGLVVSVVPLLFLGFAFWLAANGG